MAAHGGQQLRAGEARQPQIVVHLLRPPEGIFLQRVGDHQHPAAPGPHIHRCGQARRPAADYQDIIGHSWIPPPPTDPPPGRPPPGTPPGSIPRCRTGSGRHCVDRPAASADAGKCRIGTCRWRTRCSPRYGSRRAAGHGQSAAGRGWTGLQQRGPLLIVDLPLHLSAAPPAQKFTALDYQNILIQKRHLQQIKNFSRACPRMEQQVPVAFGREVW